MESIFSRNTDQFIAAYESLNFRIAAEKCFVTQPAISKSIKKIETDYEMKLFEKDGTKMIPTEFADDLYRELLTMRESVSSLRLKFQNWHNGNSGLLNIAVGVSIQSSDGFVNFISDVQKIYPNISLNFSSMIKDTSIPFLKNGEIDLWVGDISNLKKDNSFTKIFITKNPLVIYANKKNLFSKEKKIPLSKFINQKWALLRAGPVTKYNSNAGKRVEVIFKKNNIDLNENVTSFSSPAALFASSKKTKSLAIAARSLSNIANNFELTELNTEHILDLDIGILVRNKIADYNVIKYMISSLSKHLN
tara:strand:+ start:173 stop:1090 length:918 start_codon:yes stop_codon:yes gene_type:complete